MTEQKQQKKVFEIFGSGARCQLIFNLLDIFFRESMKRFQREEGRQGIGAGRAQETHEVLLQRRKPLCKRDFSGQLQHRDPVQQKRAEEPVHGREILVRRVRDRGECLDLGCVITQDLDGFLQ